MRAPWSMQACARQDQGQVSAGMKREDDRCQVDLARVGGNGNRGQRCSSACAWIAGKYTPVHRAGRPCRSCAAVASFGPVGPSSRPHVPGRWRALMRAWMGDVARARLRTAVRAAARTVHSCGATIMMSEHFLDVVEMDRMKAGATMYTLRTMPQLCGCRCGSVAHIHT
jgi:hypothetical protein